MFKKRIVVALLAVATASGGLGAVTPGSADAIQVHVCESATMCVFGNDYYNGWRDRFGLPGASNTKRGTANISMFHINQVSSAAWIAAGKYTLCDRPNQAGPCLVLEASIPSGIVWLNAYWNDMAESVSWQQW
jgi:hypothetical protein